MSVEPEPQVVAPGLSGTQRIAPGAMLVPQPPERGLHLVEQARDRLDRE